MVPQTVVQCENSSDPMTLKIVECESGITHLIQVISLLEESFMNWVPIDRIPTQCSLLPTPWEWDICWSSLHLTKCVHSQHPATSSNISIIILNQICQIQKPYSWLVTVTSQSFYTPEQSHTNTPASAWNLPKMAEYPLKSTSQRTCTQIEHSLQLSLSDKRETLKMCRVRRRQDWNWKPLD